MGTPDNPGDGTNTTCVEVGNAHSEIHAAPHTIGHKHSGQTNYDLLNKVITDTIYSDTPVNSNPNNTSDY